MLSVGAAAFLAIYAAPLAKYEREANALSQKNDEVSAKNAEVAINQTYDDQVRQILAMCLELYLQLEVSKLSMRSIL